MDVCQEKCIHEDVVERVAERMPDPDVIQDAADIFKALSEPGRLKIVTALLHSELCVCDLAVVCNISESAASHHLRPLRNLRIVRNRRDGKVVYYRLDDDPIGDLIKNCIKHAGIC